MIKECFIVVVLLNIALLGSARLSVFVEETENYDENQSIGDDYSDIQSESNEDETPYQDADSSESEDMFNDPETTLNELQDAEDWRAFEKFQMEYGKTYNTEEEQLKRFKVFQENLREIEKFNADEYDTAEYGVNEFTDLTRDELFGDGSGFNASMYENLDSSLSEEDLIPHDIPLEELYEEGEEVGDFSFDWRRKGKVTPVKNQGRCGSCWAFSAIGVLESQYAIKRNRLVQFSEQELLDCFGSCRGYMPITSLKQAKAKGGVMRESDYRYQGRKMSCRFRRNAVGVRIKNVLNLRNSNENKMKDYLVKFGPLSVCLNFDRLGHYRGGISRIGGCSKRITHAILLIGYGVERGQNYWLLKNSWGARWGDHGYFKIHRGSDMCAITSWPMFASIF